MPASIYNLGDKEAISTKSPLFNSVLNHVEQKGNFTSGISQSIYSGESADGDYKFNQAVASLEGYTDELRKVLSSYINNEYSSEEHSFSDNNINSQLSAAIKSYLATNPTAHSSKVSKVKLALESMPSDAISPAALGGFSDVGINPAMESFNEADIRTNIALSVTYNFHCAKQDEFSEAFFPMFVTDPDTAIFTIDVDLLSVFNGYKHAIDGTFKYDFGRKSLVLSMVDPSILNQDTSVNIPVYRDTLEASKANFCDKTIVPPFKVKLENDEEIITAPLKPGAEFSLLGLSSADYLIGQNSLDNTDQLDPAVYLTDLWIQLGNKEVVHIGNLDMIPESGFVRALNGQGQDMSLNFNSRWIRFDSNTKTIDGKPLTTSFATSGCKVNVKVLFNADVNLDTSLTHSSKGDVGVAKVFDTGNMELASSDAVYKKVLKDFEGASIVGYYLKSRRFNSNRREIGQLLDMNSYHMNYQIPTLAPISIQRPPAEADNSAAINKRIEALVTATKVRMNNNAVDVLLNSCKHLSQLPEVYDQEYVYSSMVLGPARFYITPYWKEDTLDVYKELQTLQSSSVLADINAVLLKYLRNVSLDMYIKSNYAAAQQMIQGSDAKKPLLIIGTSPAIASYLQIMGDTRTFSDIFDFKIVHTLNKLVRDQIFMTFGKNGPMTKSDLLNPLHYGVCVYRPEFTTILDTTRNGRVVKEITTQPSMANIPLMPIMSRIHIENLDKAAEAIVPIKTV